MVTPRRIVLLPHTHWDREWYEPFPVFQALLVEDGCGAASPRLHEATCENFQRLLGRVASSTDVLVELGAASARTPSL